MYKEFTFRTLPAAKKKRKKMKKKYGYSPSIFKVTNPRTKKKKYVVVKPKGLVRVG